MEEDYFEIYKESLTKALDTAIEEGIISTSQNYLEMLLNGEDVDNFIILLLSVHASLMTEMRQEIDQVYDSFDVELAVEEDLDALGDLVGVSRSDGSKASVILTFTSIDEVDETINIPEGVIVRTDNGVQFVTEESIIIPYGSLKVDIVAIAMVEGANQNVEAHTLTYIESALPEGVNLNVTNNYASTGGSAMQDDDEFREIVKNSYKIHQRGTLGAYEQYFTEYDGLRSYKIIPKWNGAGTIKIVLDSPEGVNYHIKKVEEELLEDVIVADEDLTIVAAEKQNINLDIIVDIEIDIIYSVSDLMKKQIASRIVDAVYTYVNGGVTAENEVIRGLGIGEDFIPFQLSMFVNSEIEEVQSLQITYPKSVVEADEDTVISIESKNDIHVEIK